MKRFPEYDIIMMALPRWDAPYSSAAWSLAKELSRHTRVFYVDNPVSLREYFVNRHTPEMKRRQEALFLGSDFFVTPDENNPNLFAVTPRVTLPVNWLPKGFLYNLWSRFNNGGMTNALNHLLRIFAIKRYVLINSFNPLIGHDLSLKVKPMLIVYQSVDDIRQAPYLRRHGPRLENEWIRKADFTLVTSSELKRTKSAHSSNVFLLPNAADATLFRQAVREDIPMPSEIRQITGGKKVITYMGNICQRLDYELLIKVANAHKDKILLMIGPCAKKDYGVSRLRSLGNVVFTGSKNINQLPGFLKYSDCCIIPFLCNQLTKSIYPLKINEYLSAGKPVVTTHFSEDITGFKAVALISRNHDEFVNLISQSIETDTESRKIERMLFAASNTWEARAHSFIDLTVDFLKHHDRRTGEPNRRKWQQTLYG
jgi:glycosyltransferase involved in cell wall biosynthesis